MLVIRPVSIISIVAKLSKMIVSARFGHLFNLNDNQHGFSINGGCNKDIFAVNNTVKYFCNKSSNIFLCVVDVYKAFDRLNHFSLLQCLIERGFTA